MKTKKGRTLRTPEQEAAHRQSIADNFNSRHPVGSRVWYWSSFKPGGLVIETTIKTPAWIVPDDFSNAGEPVVILTGIGGFVSIWNIQPIDEARRGDLKPVMRACQCGKKCGVNGFCDDCFGG